MLDDVPSRQSISLTAFQNTGIKNELLSTPAVAKLFKVRIAPKSQFLLLLCYASD